MNGEGGAVEWAKNSNCEFEIEKFALMGFSKRQIPKPFQPRKRRPEPRFSIKVNGIAIKPTKSTRFLGVIVEQGLSWKEQVAAAMAKGTMWAMQCRRIAQPTKGIPMKLAWKLYYAACIPKMLYAVDVWGTNNGGRNKNTRRKLANGQIGKLGRIQRQALLMLGAMRTTAMDILEVHANFLPFDILIDKIRHRSLLRMAMLPKSNPIHGHLRRANKIRVKRHKSPLHHLVNQFRDIKPDKTETIQTHRRPPYAKPRIKTHIENSKDRAADDLARQTSATDIQVFTDGSGYEGGIGAAATVWKGNREGESTKLHMGSDEKQIVYGGEVAGMILALEMIRREEGEVKAVMIGVDNQAAIMAVTKHEPAPGHHLIDTFLDTLDKARQEKGDFECTIHWTPGHHGVMQNEKADEKAKEAAQGDTSAKHLIPKALRGAIPWSKSAIQQKFHRKLRCRTQKRWRKSQRHAKAAKIDESMPSMKFLALTRMLPRTKASLMLQLRTGHIALNKHHQEKHTWL
jgi:ribonuclease HI